MSWLTDIFMGSASGAISGLGDAAIKIREALTGDIPAAKRAELESMALQIESAANIAQTKVNEIEARSGSLFIGGWRPGIGWVCVAGLAYQLVIYPLLCWYMAIRYPSVPVPPSLDGDTIMGLVSSMLGMGAIRQYGKNRGQG